MRTSPVRWMRCNVVSADAAWVCITMLAAARQRTPSIPEVRFAFMSIPIDDAVNGAARHAPDRSKGWPQAMAQHPRELPYAHRGRHLDRRIQSHFFVPIALGQ